MTSNSPIIGFLVPEFPGQTHIAVWRLAEAIRACGAEVHLFSTRRNRDPGVGHEELIKASQSCNYLWPLRIQSILYALLRWPLALLAIIRYIAGLREGGVRERLRVLPLGVASLQLAAVCRREKVCHLFVHSCGDAAHVVAIANRISGLPYTLRLGGDLEVYGINHSAKMRCAHFVLSAAEVHAKDVVQRIGIDPERVGWSWFGVDTGRLAPPEHRDWTAEPLHIITVARLNRAKGHELALKALALLKGEGILLTYDIVGSGPYESELRSRCKELGLEGEVVFTGALGERDVLQRLKQAHAFVLPTIGIGEGSPMAVLEAMSAGLPCICTDVGGIRALVADGIDGIIVPANDALAIAASLKELSSNRKRLEEIGKAARRTALERFSVRSVAIRLLARMLGRGPDSFWER